MGIRVSSNQILDAGIQSMDNSLADAVKWQNKINSGKNYAKASDNPYAVSRGIRLEFDTAKIDMYKSNQNYVAGSMANAGSQFDSLINQMNSIKQLMVQSQNGAYNEFNFGALKIQAEQYLLTMKSQSTALDGTGKPIYPDVINQVEIEPNVRVSAAIKFSDAFGLSSAGIADISKVDVMQKIADFVTYLDQRSKGVTLTKTAQIISSGLTAAFDQLSTEQQRSGSIAAQVDNSKTAIGALGTQLAATSSALLDTDMAAATAAYTRSQTLLNAAQAMFAKLQQMNLFSRL